MKKTKILGVLILLVCMLGSAPVQATNGAMRLAQINQKAATDLTYLRIEPRNDADITFGYYKGAFLMILSEDTNGWCFVSIGNRQGYVRKDEITAADALSSTATLPVILAKPESETGWVNLRQLPSLEAEGLQRLTMGEQAILLGITDDWYHVMVGDTLGYIKAEFTAFSDSYIELKSGDLRVSLYELVGQQSASATGSKNPGAQLDVTQTTQTASGTKEGYQMRAYTQAPNSKSTVSIKYPYFNGNDALNALVNQKIQSFLEHPASYYPQFGFTADYQAAVTLNNSKMVSIVFWGVSEIEKSKPYTVLETLNIDLSTMREVKIANLYKIDAGFEDVYFQKAYFPSNPVTSYSASLFSEMLTYQTREYNALGPFFTLDAVQCFLKPDGIVISVGAVHATGSDHFEAPLHYEDIQQYYLPTQKYWEN